MYILYITHKSLFLFLYKLSIVLFSLYKPFRMHEYVIMHNKLHNDVKPIVAEKSKPFFEI